MNNVADTSDTENMSLVRRNVLLLAMCLGLSMTGMVILITISALAGHMLATNKELATLPLAVMFTITMLATVPASLFMGRFGRRIGFTIGQSAGIVAALTSAYAIQIESFILFVVASGIFGIHNAFWQYYRFAAAESAPESYRSRAISYVMVGGVFAALVGPELAKLTREFFPHVTFAGSYVTISVISLQVIMLIQFIRIPRPARGDTGAGGRPLKTIVRQPVFIVAVLAAMLGYGVMNLVMTATPLAMAGCGYSFDDSAFVIQWHVLGMFIPSFFTGHLIRRFGVLNIILTGALLNAASMAINLAGIDLMNFWFALLMLGVGWNFMFIGGTTLVTQAYKPGEQAKVQAVNEVLITGTVAVASFSSGALLNTFGWQTVNAAVALPLLIAFIAVLWLRIARGYPDRSS